MYPFKKTKYTQGITIMHDVIIVYIYGSCTAMKIINRNNNGKAGASIGSGILYINLIISTEVKYIQRKKVK